MYMFGDRWENTSKTESLKGWGNSRLIFVFSDASLVVITDWIFWLSCSPLQSILLSALLPAPKVNYQWVAWSGPTRLLTLGGSANRKHKRLVVEKRESSGCLFLTPVVLCLTSGSKFIYLWPHFLPCGPTASTLTRL